MNRAVLSSSAISDRGLSERRPHNEDSYLEMPQIGIFAVADGVGGSEAGEVASQMAVEILGEAFTNRTAGSDAEMVMRIALERANSAIHQMSNDLSQLSKMATTIAALHLDGNVATIGHAGDSRIYRSKPDGSLIRETEDHSMVADEVRAGRMTEEQAENHPGKNIINRALGAEPTVDIELKTIMVDAGSSFLLCSDGITRHIPDAEIREMLASGENSEDICARLKDLCFERGAEDNLTAVVVQTSGADAVDTLPVIETDNDILALPDSEEDTVATARFAPSPDDDLLEIETSTLVLPRPSDFFEDPTITPDEQFEDTLRLTDEPKEEAFVHEPVPIATEPETQKIEVPFAAPIAAPTPEAKPSGYDGEQLSMVQDEPSSFGRFAAYAAVLALGSLIGLAVYHFALRPQSAAPAAEIPSQMASNNIALSAFEDGRRLVDADPAAYLAKAPAPRDAEELYNLGRAQFLTGDFVKARGTLLEVRKRIAETDIKNRKVIESDIAVFLTVTNDPTSQGILKKELEAAKSVTSANAAPNK
jgi:protein phosphatase